MTPLTNRSLFITENLGDHTTNAMFVMSWAPRVVHTANKRLTAAKTQNPLAATVLFHHQDVTCHEANHDG